MYPPPPHHHHSRRGRSHGRNSRRAPRASPRSRPQLPAGGGSKGHGRFTDRDLQRVLQPRRFVLLGARRRGTKRNNPRGPPPLRPHGAGADRRCCLRTGRGHIFLDLPGRTIPGAVRWHRQGHSGARRRKEVRQRRRKTRSGKRFRHDRGEHRPGKHRNLTRGKATQHTMPFDGVMTSIRILFVVAVALQNVFWGRCGSEPRARRAN
mmetsp:Transcript_1470/g.3594  ORF Transcript_1470/g.3594 Transcript_1470/m.3594 type:complete len:207 (+) Transcript_1470:428-1048(+)